jgi:hypothetical protein
MLLCLSSLNGKREREIMVVIKRKPEIKQSSLKMGVPRHSLYDYE